MKRSFPSASGLNSKPSFSWFACDNIDAEFQDVTVLRLGGKCVPPFPRSLLTPVQVSVSVSKGTPRQDSCPDSRFLTLFPSEGQSRAEFCFS